MAELLASLSLAIDMGVGMPMEWVLRSCLLSLRLGEAAGLDAERLKGLYYIALLRHVGCTSTSANSAVDFGDDISLGEGFQADMGNMAEAMRFMFHNVGKDRPLPERLRMMAKLFLNGPEITREYHVSHCEIAERLAERLGFAPGVTAAFRHIYERWDGKGTPKGVKGSAIALEVRVVQLAQDMATLNGVGGPAAALEAARKRSGGSYDPVLVGVFLSRAQELLAPLAVESVWDAVLAAEPGEARMIPEGKLDEALEAVADFADLKSPYTIGHSRGAAELADAAARICGLPAPEAIAVRRAALVQDLGRVGVSAGIWGKAGALDDGEWERVRMHAYFTERILARSPALSRLGELSALHHERLDGSGYHRRTPADRISLQARILAAADVYRALIEDRPHRAAFSREAAAAEIRAEARMGRLDSAAVEAVLEAAGHRASNPAGSRAPAAGLSARELEVLRLLVHGLSNKEMGKRLFISPKTVGHHIQHIYGKLNVSSRAGAALYAARNRILD